MFMRHGARQRARQREKQASRGEPAGDSIPGARVTACTEGTGPTARAPLGHLPPPAPTCHLPCVPFRECVCGSGASAAASRAPGRGWCPHAACRPCVPSLLQEARQQLSADHRDKVETLDIDRGCLSLSLTSPNITLKVDPTRVPDG